MNCVLHQRGKSKNSGKIQLISFAYYVIMRIEQSVYPWMEHHGRTKNACDHGSAV
jgi:hypothetical protein